MDSNAVLVVVILALIVGVFMWRQYVAAQAARAKAGTWNKLIDIGVGIFMPKGI